MKTIELVEGYEATGPDKDGDFVIKVPCAEADCTINHVYISKENLVEMLGSYDNTES